MSDEDRALPEYEECTIEVHAAEEGGYITTVILADGRRYAGAAPVNLDQLHARLFEVSQEPFTYGAMLYETFLGDTPKQGLAVARTRAQDAKKRLRLRLDIPPDARRLHILNWEWLFDPASRTTFAASPDYALLRLGRHRPLSSTSIAIWAALAWLTLP
jgi:hypothetical protein